MLFRKRCMSDASIYKQQAKFCGGVVPDALRLRALNDENAGPKRMLSDDMIDNVTLKGLLGDRGNAWGYVGNCHTFGVTARDERTAGM